MATNTPPNDWFPLPTGDPQVDENQRRIWQSLYYLRDQQSNNSNSNVATSAKGMSGTVTFRDANNNAVSVVIGNKTFHSLTFANGLFVAGT